MASTNLTFVLLTNLRAAHTSRVLSSQLPQYAEQHSAEWDTGQRCTPVDSVVFSRIQHAEESIRYLPWCPVGGVDCNNRLADNIS